MKSVLQKTNEEKTDVYVYPTTYPQKQIWFLHQLDPDSSAYNIPFAYDLSGRLDTDFFISAFKEIVDRHETFRTLFRELDEGLAQIVFSQVDVDIKTIQFESRERQDTEINDYISRWSTSLFDLTKDQLFRCEILKFSENEYTILFNFHHIIIDHISIVQFAHELEAIYTAKLKNESIPLVLPELQYADYSVWQDEWQSYDKLEEKLEFWQTQLEDRADFLTLPTDYPRSSENTGQGTELHIHIPLALSIRLKDFSKQNSISPYICLISALAATYYRYSHQSDVIIGTPFANRGHQPELEIVMGCFINTLPIPVDFSSNPSFKELLAVVRQVVFAVAAHQETPFEMVVEVVKPKRDPSYNPIFQAGFTFQEPPMEIALPDCQIKSQAIHNQAAKFDLFTWLWDTDDGIKGTIEYNTGLFKKKTVEQIARHFIAILDSVVTQPDQKISMLDYLSEDEVDQILIQWNQTELNFDTDITFPVIFSKTASQNPENIAVNFDGVSISYRVLDEKTNQLANYLVSEGVKPGCYIGVAIERSIDMLVATLAVMKSGACYIPIDPEFPAQRIQYMLEHSEAHYCIIHGATRDIGGLSDQMVVVDLDLLSDKIGVQNGDAPEVMISSDDLAYVIYTSGSTGTPKGVKVPHGAVSNFLQSMANTPGLDSADKLLAVTTLSFDIAVLELYLPLIVGAQVVIAGKQDIADGNRLISFIDDHRITVLQATPATWKLLLGNQWEGNNKLKALVGGESLSASLCRALLPLVGELWNMYGPTETTVWSSCIKLDDAEDITIGRPIHNTRFYVLDANRQLVPPGVSGELYIGGKGVTSGYLKSPDLTGDRYLENPWSDEISDRIYRTGDLVRYRRDGRVEYLNRIDNQIKLRGFRIELGEIESVLSNIKGIREQVVTLVEEREDDARIVAYFVPESGEQILPTMLRKAMRMKLPEYMLPQHFVEMDKLPLTPNGKIDIKALTSPFAIETQVGDKEKPVTAHQKRLAEIWADTIGIDINSIGLHDNFFDLGGHSLLSINVISIINKETSVRLNPRVLVLGSLEYVAEMCSFQPENSNPDGDPRTELSAQSEEIKSDKGLLSSILRLWSRK